MDLATLISIIIGVPTVLGIICKIRAPFELTPVQFICLCIVLIILILGVIYFTDTLNPDAEPEFEDSPGTEAVRVPVPLSQCECIDDSNQPGSTSDVFADDWTDIFGNYHANSIRFWVIDSPEWNNAEHITYRLGGQYESLSGTIVAAESCDPNSRFIFSIYIDNVLAYQTESIDTADTYHFTCDISNANEIRIVCSTDTPYYGYCIFDALVS